MATVQPLYLFECGDTDRYAVSRDMTGRNLPTNGHAWLLRGTIAAEDLQDDLLPVVDEIKEKGFCILPHELE
jgi:hypothetical protein